MDAPLLISLLALAAALAPSLAIFVPSRSANRAPVLMANVVRGLALASLGLAVAAAVALAFASGPVQTRFLSVGPVAISVYLDAVAAIMLLLVAFLGCAVATFSRNYLDGDANQGRFFRWLSVTVGSVLLLVVSGNLAMFTLAWMATSLCLHQLLTFYPERRAAILAARKKYLVSRLGDLCLLGALVIAWRQFGSLDYGTLFAAAAQSPSGGGIPTIAFLLVAGAMLKSAQFPFHGWLPDTMETPTPVSALMHAGIINAGGYLVIRFSPLVALSPAAMETLAGVGAVTALFGSLVMITQTSVKRALAFSTIAQMGFMMLQCGLGAFALALLHLVAHSLYKAHAFLSSGGVIAQARLSGTPPPRRYRGATGAVLAFGVAGILVVIAAILLDHEPWRDPARFALSLILGIAVAQLLWNWWATAVSARGWLLGVAVGLGIVLLSFGLHAGAEWLVGARVAAAPDSVVAWSLAILAPLAFLLVALRAFLPPGWVSTPFGRALYVHAYNGFYLNTLANRFLQTSRISQS